MQSLARSLRPARTPATATASCAGLVIERKPRQPRLAQLELQNHTPSISTCLGLDDHTACLGDELKSKLSLQQLKLWLEPRGVQLRAALIYDQPMPQAARSSARSADQGKSKQSKHFHFSNERVRKETSEKCFNSFIWRIERTSPHDANLYAAPAPAPATAVESDVDSYVDVKPSSGSSSVFGFAPLRLRCKLNTLRIAHRRQIRLH